MADGHCEPGENGSPNCLTTGKCTIHDVEIERRKTDRKELNYLREAFIKLEESNEDRAIQIHNRLNGVSNKVMGIFVSLGLISLICFGCYYYIGVVDKRNDRGEEILLNKINADARSAKEERTNLVSQVVTLLTADAEQKEWQRGMITQLELLNTHIRDIVDLKNEINRSQLEDHGIPQYSPRGE